MDEGRGILLGYVRLKYLTLLNDRYLHSTEILLSCTTKSILQWNEWPRLCWTEGHSQSRVLLFATTFFPFFWSNRTFVQVDHRRQKQQTYLVIGCKAPYVLHNTTHRKECVGLGSRHCTIQYDVWPTISSTA